MKYIRTKDGKIHEIVLKQSNLYFVKANLSDGSDIFGDFCYHQEDIFKESDTIKELCDEFLVCHNGKIICQFAKNVWDYESIKYLGTSNDFYGAIWVFDDNGAPTLKPVAKMNEKGDLELI